MKHCIQYILPSLLFSQLPLNLQSFANISHQVPITRSLFFGQIAPLMLFSEESTVIPHECSLADPIRLLDSVYGPIQSSNFPLPMPCNEAGLCADGKQRRYLWTDAFAVLAYLSIADRYEKEGNLALAQEYRQASYTLIDVVHECLGKPRSNKNNDKMSLDPSSPTGYVGLRIGKVLTRNETDSGMTYDGMYFHYLDKWLLALTRAGRINDGVRIAKSSFPYFYDDGFHTKGGIRWKLSVDGTTPPGRNYATPNDDTLVGLVTFSLLEAHRSSDYGDKGPNLLAEIDQLRKSLKGYTPRVSDDPLGWGLEVLYDQFLEGQPRWPLLAKLQSTVLDPYHLALPFRLYGALMGARIGGRNVAPTEKVNQLIGLSLTHEKEAMESSSTGASLEEHSSINRVMLTTCLLSPGSLGRQPGDPVIKLSD